MLQRENTCLENNTKMEKIYLVDFENVHNKGLENIDTLTETDQVHIFYTENASNISLDILLAKGKGTAIVGHKVPARKQSVDMHLVSYLGYLLGINKTCLYIIVSNDKDYDNIIKFWRENGIRNIVREQKIPSGSTVNQKKTTPKTETINHSVSSGIVYELSGKDRCELNVFMQHKLIELGYSGRDANQICKCVVAHCNDERMLCEIHNDLREEFSDYSTVYEDVKTILKGFAPAGNRVTKRELQVRSFCDRYFKKKIYRDQKKEIIQIILESKSRQAVNNQLMKLFHNGNQVKEIIDILQPLIKDMPGK